ncbi:hypothetical protein [Bradyrhizobium sp. ORS 375]|uniref:hypothetical protein n=1 Tax=Bradyrhizobium sp. (strain ORS 375) TaxID=566679 RepID=UPI0024C0C1BE|nr:hypothetical protein [Bradyrhizobium sp. ORS 375]
MPGYRGDIGDVLVVVMLVVIVLVMVMMIMLMMVMAVVVVIMLVVSVGLMMIVSLVCLSSAGRVAGRSGRGLCGFRGRLFGGSNRLRGRLRGDRIVLLVRRLVRTLLRVRRVMMPEGDDRRFGEAMCLAVLAGFRMRLIRMRLIRMIVLGVSVMLVRLVVGLMTFGVNRLTALGGLHDLALNALAAAAAPRAAVTVATAVGAVLALFLGLAVGPLLGLDQRLPVGDRDLIVVGMDFAEGEEAVAVAAVLDEGRLQRRLNAGDLRQVDVAPELLALGSFEIKFLDAVAADDNHPGLFRVGSIDQHLVGHIGTLGGDGRGWPRARGALSDDATVHLIRG